MKEIPLTQGLVALVDDEDYESLAQFKWCASWTGKKWYAVRRLPRPEPFKIGKKIYMHRVILDSGPKLQIDHRNGNSLDNQRHNLRVATTSQNGKNRGKQRDNTSGFKGVIRYRGKWRAVIKSDRSPPIHLGTYDRPEDAAVAYDAAARRLHGEFAHLNFGDMP